MKRLEGIWTSTRAWSQYIAYNKQEGKITRNYVCYTMFCICLTCIFVCICNVFMDSGRMNPERKIRRDRICVISITSKHVCDLFACPGKLTLTVIVFYTVRHTTFLSFFALDILRPVQILIISFS